ncbi:MAG: HipA domain-containing protein [Gammaproteobacteria bacterium]|nr:HipA domain-containing protein [Gammaproteobacteria bacterium]MDE0271788.1 HipA domain-containing protein [Gammaproteobacteria bacterium]
MPSMKVLVRIHGEDAFVLDAHPNNLFAIKPQDAMGWLTSGRQGSGGTVNCRQWLRGILPQSGSVRDVWEALGRALVGHELGRDGPPMDVLKSPEALLWAFAEAEWPGAVTAHRLRDGRPGTAFRDIMSNYPRLDDREMARLVSACVRMEGFGWRKAQYPEPRHAWVSLGGTRPKTAVTLDADGNWRQGGRGGRTGQLNTWILKVEDSRDNPGGAGIESICQRALAHAGVPSAETMSRTFGNWQCVLSRRTDRSFSGSTVLPIHQEEFRQAAGTEDLFDHDETDLGPQWREAYDLLLDEGRGMDLTRLIAGCWLLGHGDMHRGNWGYNVSSPEEGKEKRVTLAPAYDVSSSCGSMFSERMCFAIGGEFWFRQIAARQWARHAEECGLGVDEVWAEVGAMCEAMPDAFSQAVRECRAADENREQAEVTRRIGLVAEHIGNRVAHFARTLKRSKPRQEGLAP